MSFNSRFPIYWPAAMSSVSAITDTSFCVPVSKMKKIKGISVKCNISMKNFNAILLRQPLKLFILHKKRGWFNGDVLLDSCQDALR